MMRIGRIPIIQALIVGLVGICSTMASAEDRRYREPRWNDTRLDVCLSWGRDCGQPVADQYCLRKKHRRAAEFGTENASPTQLWRSSTRCNGSFCAAFTHITCTDPFPDAQVFVNPAWNGHRLDNCERWAANCGRPAADAYCKAKGFTRAVADYPDGQAGNSETIVMSSNQVCTGPGCVGFQMIICE